MSAAQGEEADDDEDEDDEDDDCEGGIRATGWLPTLVATELATLPLSPAATALPPSALLLLSSSSL
jgi:hypothetical protein